jgi:hypothetical protein
MPQGIVKEQPMKTETSYRVIATYIDSDRPIQSAYDLELQLNAASAQGWRLEQTLNMRV